MMPYEQAERKNSLLAGRTLGQERDGWGCIPFRNCLQLSFATLSLLLTVTDAEFDGHTYSVPISSTSSAFTRWRELQSSSVVTAVIWAW